MGFIQNGQVIVAAKGAKETKKLAKQQALAAEEATAFNAELLKQLAYQSQTLAEIRDLLAQSQAQQVH